MIDRETRDAAVDKISYIMIDVLNSWLTNEKRNLDGFIAHPEGHVDYNEFLIMDYQGLATRSHILGEITKGLAVISAYKQGLGSVSRSLHDIAVDAIPSIIYKRLYEWTHKKYLDMSKVISELETNPPIPIQDYAGLVSFNIEKYTTELNLYKDATEGLAIVLQFIAEKE